MKYGHAVLGESLELYQEAVEWGKDQERRIEKNEKARSIILESLAPMLEEKRKKIIGQKFKEEGMKKQSKETAKRMIQANEPGDKIVLYTGLEKNVVDKLARNMNTVLVWNTPKE